MEGVSGVYSSALWVSYQVSYVTWKMVGILHQTMWLSAQLEAFEMVSSGVHEAFQASLTDHFSATPLTRPLHNFLECFGLVGMHPLKILLLPWMKHGEECESVTVETSLVYKEKNCILC